MENVPKQQKGNSVDVVETSCAQTEEEARTIYDRAVERLLDVNHWHDITTPEIAQFQLTDAEGNNVFRPAKEGDLFRIDIPGPGPKGGYDWVRIEKLINTHGADADEVSMRVRPVPEPTHVSDAPDHFFGSEATSTFSIRIYHLEVNAAIRGRNEVPNTETPRLVDKIRNIAIASGAVLGASNVQWNALAKGLLK